MYDSIIIGKGPAGISSAIYLKRAGFKVLVIGKDGGSLEKAELIENYYGFEKPIKADKLLTKGIKQAQNLNIEVISDEVTGIEYNGDLLVKTITSSYSAKTLILALGKKKKTVSIKGVKEFAGSGVSFCAVCDGFFYKNKKVAVIGNGNYAFSEAEYLSKFASEVKIFSNGQVPTFKNSNNFEIVQDKIIEIFGKERVEGIKTEKNDYKTEGLFIALGSAGVEDFAVKLGLETQNGNIVADSNLETNIPGVFAAGDCIGGFLQIAKAVSDGAMAANSAIKYLRKLQLQQ